MKSEKLGEKGPGWSGCPELERWDFPGVQWLGLCVFSADGPGSTPHWGTRIPQAARCP